MEKPNFSSGFYLESTYTAGKLSSSESKLI